MSRRFRYSSRYDDYDDDWYYYNRRYETDYDDDYDDDYDRIHEYHTRNDAEEQQRVEAEYTNAVVPTVPTVPAETVEAVVPPVEQPANIPLIRNLLNMTSLSPSTTTKLSYVDQLFKYLLTVPTFMEKNARFLEVSIAKAQDLRRQLCAQPIYDTLDAFLAKYVT